jgi:hypothetical protein
MDTIKPPFTIREAAEQTGLTVHMLRYYERIAGRRTGTAAID